MNLLRGKPQYSSFIIFVVMNSVALRIFWIALCEIVAHSRRWTPSATTEMYVVLLYDFITQRVSAYQK